MAQTDINLAPGEKGMYSISFRPNLVLFWLRSTFLITNRRIAVKVPNTILGIIPLGYEERAMPMGSISGVNASVKVKVGRLILFGLLTLACLAQTFSNGFSLGWALFMLLFAALTANSILANLQVTNNGGGVSEATVSILDKSALEQFKNKANEYIYSSTTAGTSWDDAVNHPPQNGAQQQYRGPVSGQQDFGSM
ncbi:hypothetical protein H0194_08140 [Corynebacterium incognita]|uniref:Uncharacterized protein n=1 Tax=Corynebacterium incognita TaxID=2754725 RepID=A0A7G7CN79_9CORY|nr:hypothetical protein [Corynebacterium incognita]QNE89045.1 hypothetical protein H0194_08140 [Corynebacterium incognita]